MSQKTAWVTIGAMALAAQGDLWANDKVDQQGLYSNAHDANHNTDKLKPVVDVVRFMMKLKKENNENRAVFIDRDEEEERFLNYSLSDNELDYEDSDVDGDSSYAVFDLATDMQDAESQEAILSHNDDLKMQQDAQDKRQQQLAQANAGLASQVQRLAIMQLSYYGDRLSSLYGNKRSYGRDKRKQIPLMMTYILQGEYDEAKEIYNAILAMPESWYKHYTGIRDNEVLKRFKTAATVLWDWDAVQSAKSEQKKNSTLKGQLALLRAQSQQFTYGPQAAEKNINKFMLCSYQLESFYNDQMFYGKKSAKKIRDIRTFVLNGNQAAAKQQYDSFLTHTKRSLLPQNHNSKQLANFKQAATQLGIGSNLSR